MPTTTPASPRPTARPRKRPGKPVPGKPSLRGVRRSSAEFAIDRHIGRRLRERRSLLGLSQEVLAAKLGLSFQQVQKYERGANRVGGSRLHQVAGALGVPHGYFFEGLPANGDGPPAGSPPAPEIGRAEFVAGRLMAALSPKKRAAATAMLRAMAEEGAAA